MEKDIIYIVVGISQRFTGESVQCIVGAFRDREKAEVASLHWSEAMNTRHQEEGVNWKSRCKIDTQTLY